MSITMQDTMQTLNPFYIDALREVGNIGAGNAMTSLATMLDHTVDMSVPEVGILPLMEFAKLTGGPEAVAVGVYMLAEGEAPGHVAFLWPEATACRIAEEMLGQPRGSVQELGELERSALVEMGNILASSYLVAICEMTGLNLYSSPPALAVDMTAAIFSTIAAAFDSMENQVLTIVTHIEESYETLEGYFMYIPEPGSLQVMLRALQMEG